jgi:hypothetical protein
MHCYEIRLAAYWLPRVYGDDARARRVTARWIRLFWRKYVEHITQRHPGSMAAADAEGWYSPPTCEIYRSGALLPGYVVPCNGGSVIESFELSPEPIAEFVRVYDRKIPGRR